MVETRFEIDDSSVFRRICGHQDRNLKRIEELAQISIIPRGNTLILKVLKENIGAIERLFHFLTDYIALKEDSYEFTDFDLKYLISSILNGSAITPEDLNRLKIALPDSGKSILPKTMNQASYINSIFSRPITFASGPAGTGKTYLAVVLALKFFLTGKSERIILTRPAVEAGESLGYLPGDLIQKVNPYLRPLYDALFDLQPFEKVSKLIEKGSIEIAPLAYMRGRTLNNCFIILDEAQNTTSSQMKMFLTRLGNNSKMVISGDDTQIDLEKPKKSGLIHAKRILHDVADIGFIHFTKADISRHPIVEKIVAAYERAGYND
jgi:phosphate starvation-inducible PhoH-like protein